MRIKTKLILSFGLLLGLVVTLGIVGSKYIFSLRTDTENILRDNYKSLEYAKNMLAALDKTASPDAVPEFENNLRKQERNVTEVGENLLTKDLRRTFGLFKLHPDDNSLKTALRDKLLKITSLNMQAIEYKSKIAGKTANNAFFWISITSTLCFLIAFTVFFNLPSDIANPIRELTESIKQIAAKNYSQRITSENKNEFSDLAHTFNLMAGKLEEYDNSNLSQLMFEKKRIETLINNMSDPVIGLDEQQRFIFMNQEALKTLNISEQDYLNQPVDVLRIKNDLVRKLTDDLYLTPTPGIKPQPVKIFADHKESYFEKQLIPISIALTGEEQTRSVGHVIILRNVTEYKEIDFAKTNYIATVSHELKTPISSIKMSLQLLENSRIGQLNEEQALLLHSIADDTNRLLKITGELLNITQIESGNIQLSITSVDVKELLLYAMNALKTQAVQKNIYFRFECPDTIPKVQADNEKTAWVLTNLLSNAVRYSYENATIFIAVKEEDNRVHIAIKDTGIGIADEYRDKIFNRYFRVPGTKNEGNGLGLSISKEFIEAQGGQIFLESRIGEGSTFTITLKSIV
jgi:signal transduction histidine kinase